MAEGSELSKEETAELNEELATLRKFANGSLSPLDKDVLKVMGKVGIGGAGGVLVGRYAAERLYPRAEDTDQNNNKLMRHATEAAVGLGGAMVLRKVSPAMAIGFGVVAIGDAVANAAAPTAFEYLDDWFRNDGARTVAAGEMFTESVAPRRAAGGGRY